MSFSSLLFSPFHYALLYLLLYKVLALPEPLNHQRLALCSLVNVLNIICRALEVARGVVTLRQEDVIRASVIHRLIQRDGSAHEFLSDLAQAFKSRLQLKVVVGLAFGDCRYNGNVVTLRADIVCGRNHGNVDVFESFSDQAIYAGQSTYRSSAQLAIVG